MIINDLYLLRRAFAPQEADTPLIIDPDTMLPLPVAAQSLEPVSGDGCEVLQLFGVIQHAKLAPRHPFDVAEPATPLTVIQPLGLLAAEGSYHTESISWPPLYGGR